MTETAKPTPTTRSRRWWVILITVVLAVGALPVLGCWAVVGHCRGQVEAAVGEPMAFSDLIAVDSGLAVGFEQRDSLFQMVRYYYVIPDGRVMMRLADSDFMIRYDDDDVEPVADP